MKAILAGFIVYIGLMVFVVKLSKVEWLEGMPGIVDGLIIFVYIAILLSVVYVTFHPRVIFNLFRKKREIEIDDDRTWEFSVEVSARELLKAERAEREMNSGMGIVFRLIVILFGVMLIILPSALGDEKDSIASLLSPVIVGFFILRSFLYKPTLARYRIRKRFTAVDFVKIVFDKTGISVSLDSESFNRNWAELYGMHVMPDGIIFFWHSGEKNWIPKSVFNDKNEMEHFAGFVDKQMMLLGDEE